MASILRQLKGLLPLLVLAAVSLRVLTGAAEVQVNFTSIIIEQQKSFDSEVDKESMLRGVAVSNLTDASSIPDNQKTYATYKKYLVPESETRLPSLPPQIPLEAVGTGGILVNSNSQKVVYRPTSHSPPAVVPASQHTHTTEAVQSADLENYFGKIKNSYFGEFYSF